MQSLNEFEAKQGAMPTDELIILAKKMVNQLAKTYGKSHTMSIPPQITDTDMILSEVIKRFEKLTSKEVENSTTTGELEIRLKAEFVFQLHSKQEWINRVPHILPKKKFEAEKLVWVDKNGHSFEIGLDFNIAQITDSYPCKVYRLIRVAEANEMNKIKHES